MSRRNRKGRAVHGILLLDKPAGGSSNHALQRAKRLFGAKKAGHTGSLDPLATGMLPICFGEATKLSAFLLDADKGYETTMQLGVTTTSADADGDVVNSRPVPGDLTLASFSRICEQFIGPLQQVPPMVSAIKIDGQRLYKLAREGKEVERPARSVVIRELQVLSFSGSSARLRVRCSKGTYIRSLVTDIGEAIGCGAHVRELRRSFVSPFEQQHRMVSIGELENLVESSKQHGFSELDALLLPLDAGLGHLTAVCVDEQGWASFERGQVVPCLPLSRATEAISDRGLQPESSIEQSLAFGANSSDTRHQVELCRVYGTSGRLAGLGELTSCGELVAPRRVLQWD